ncbi:LacI family DNA-binding transcriptional regulator [Microbacterium soli]|uniref:LacI family DNA-binding transcriptional regulator n=1 Tax=Microbacterium soli TaxID=446075 RepID=A0ABP7NBW6_9MICO
MPTSLDVARLAGVSQSTVSRALRDSPRVSPETRQRVRQAAEELEYVLQESGRSLSTRTSHRVAIISEALSNPYFAELVDYLRRLLAARGYKSVFLADSSDEILTSNMLTDGSYDGAVITTAARDSRLAADLRHREFPHVFVNRSVDDPLSVTCEFDNEKGAQLVAELLVKNGHKDIRMISGPSRFSTAYQRSSGLVVGLQRLGVDVGPDAIVECDYTIEGAGRAAALDILGGPNRPTALVCVNDFLAIGALNAARRLGIGVPDELTIIGFDDISYASWDLVALTTVRGDQQELASAGVAQLVEMMEGSTTPRRMVLDVDMVLRSTHGPATA